MKFPLKICDIPKFEKKDNISVKMFGYEKSMYNLVLTKERDSQGRKLSLLFHQELQQAYGG